MTTRSRYQADATPDYSHRFHAGNVGDVWKHCVLLHVLEAAARGGGRIAYVESHAGEGWYPLGPTGEWTEGIGRLRDLGDRTSDDGVVRYLALCDELGRANERGYPGSPLLARAALGDGAEIALWERDDAAFEALARNCSHSRTRLVHGDGLAALAGEVAGAEERSDTVVALVDPPWTRKADWIEVPDALAAAARASRRATLLLWYPLKSLTRPNAMIARLRAVGVPGSIVELTTTPLDERRNRLNGSGVILIRPPDDAVARICASAPMIGERCATHAGTWSLRAQSWREAD